MRNIRRLKDIIHANVNSALDKAENPEKLIRYMIGEMEESLTDLKSSCAAKMAQKTRTEQEITRLQETVARWSERAELAVDKGKDELAREALVEKNRAERKLEAAKNSLSRLETIISECRSNTKELEQKLQSVREKQRTLIERGIHARETLLTREQIREAEGEDAYRRFSQFEQRIERMEAEAEMAGFGSKPSEDAFSSMEHEDEIEDQLSELKKKAKSKTKA